MGMDQDLYPFFGGMNIQKSELFWTVPGFPPCHAPTWSLCPEIPFRPAIIMTVAFGALLTCVLMPLGPRDGWSMQEEATHGAGMCWVPF